MEPKAEAEARTTMTLESWRWSPRVPISLASRVPTLPPQTRSGVFARSAFLPELAGGMQDPPGSRSERSELSETLQGAKEEVRPSCHRRAGDIGGNGLPARRRRLLRPFPVH